MAPSLRYGSQNIKRHAQAPLVANVQYVLPTPIKRMQNETTLRFDRTAAQDRHIRPLVAGKVELGQHLTAGQPRNSLTYIAAHRSIPILGAERHDGLIEIGIAY